MAREKTNSTPPGTILHREDTDIYAVVVTLNQALRYLQSDAYRNYKKGRLEQLKQRKIPGTNIIYTPGSELMQNPSLPFHFIPKGLPGYHPVEKEEIWGRMNTEKAHTNSRKQAELNKLEKFLGFLYDTKEQA